MEVTQKWENQSGVQNEVIQLRGNKTSRFRLKWKSKSTWLLCNIRNNEKGYLSIMKICSTGSNFICFWKKLLGLFNLLKMQVFF